MTTKTAERLTAQTAEYVSLGGGPKAVYVLEGVRYFVQITNYGGFTETWDVEIAESATSFDSGWQLVATAYGRDQMWVIVDGYLNLA